MKKIESVAAALFGLIFVALAFAVAVETFMRKVLNRSLQGVDELGGYALAIGAALAFVVAIIGGAHIRIDLLHDRFPRGARVVLNSIAMLALATTAGALFYMGWHSWQESIQFNSTAQTPWATPLRLPQAGWVAALAVFAFVAVVYAMHTLYLLVTGQALSLDRHYAPRSSKDELEEELRDIKARGAADVVAGPR